MKKLLLFSTVMIASAWNAGAQIPNSGFENWETTPGDFQVPADWATMNGFAPGGLFFPCTKSTDHYPANVGQYSMRLESNLLFQQAGWGISVTDTFAYPFEPAFPIQGHPTSLHGYYKFDSEAGDEVWITLVLFNQGELLFNNQFRSPVADVPEWTPFQIDFDTYVEADSATLMIFNFYPTTQEDGPNGNSVLLVDNLNFDSPITSIAEANAEDHGFALSPNPTTGLVNIFTSGTVDRESTLSVYSVLGTLMHTEPLRNERQTLDLTRVPAGTYVVVVRTDNAVTTQRLVLQH